ncbi:MAG: alpha-ketoacid dehydrogenase subunit beta [Vampirovibrionales bacterium]|nr:alpha-ketoacid dehydrogenase subunit beta [Vampirovibrionales bacterium]
MPTLTFVQAVQNALDTEMTRDSRVVVLGEDVAVNGGVFRATEGLLQKFGAHRVLDTPLSETGIIGLACGMALNGLKPVAEIQFADYVFPAYDQIVSELAKFRYRTGGQYTTPVVVRMPTGGGIRGGHYHSQSPEAAFTQTPGLVVISPSTPADAKGLLASAIRAEDPVIFLEPKKIYRTLKEDLPEGEHLVPIGPLRLVQAGDDITLISYGAMVEICQKAAEKAKTELGASVEILDLRTLYPVDEAGILTSVQKTGRAVIVHEAPKTCGYGAEIAALIAEKALDSLQAPVARVGGFDTPFPYTLEAVYLPHPIRVFHALAKVLNYD